MSGLADIKTAVRQLVGGDIKRLELCKVIALSKAEQTVDVAPVDGDAEIYGVKLQPHKQSEGVLVYPKVGSHVLVGMLDSTTGYVLSHDQAESVAIKVQGSDLHTEVNNLIGVVDKLIGIMNKFQLATNVGPTISVMPHIVTELNAEKSNLSNVKTKINKILKPF